MTNQQLVALITGPKSSQCILMVEALGNYVVTEKKALLRNLKATHSQNLEYEIDTSYAGLMFIYLKSKKGE